MIVYGLIYLLLFWYMFMERSFILELCLVIFSVNVVFFILVILKIFDFIIWGLIISVFVYVVMFVCEYRKNRYFIFINFLFGFVMGVFSLVILYEYSLVNVVIVLLL